MSNVALASTSASLMKQTEGKIDSLAGSLNPAQAISLAETTQQYHDYTTNSSVAYSSIFNTWSFDSAANVTWQTVNVVFSLASSSRFYGYLVVTEDPALSGVSQVATQRTNMTAGTSTTWSGYTFYGNSNANTAVYEAYSGWTVPSVSEPWSYACFFIHCDLAVWPGLTATSGGGSAIVQAGTDSGLYCTSGCSYYYYGWYEFYPSAGVTCSNFPVSPSDSAAADVINHAEWGGSSTVYDIYVYDFTKGNTCSVTNQSFTSFTTPYYGQFIGERPSIGGSSAQLPKFGSVTMSGSAYYSGALRGISSPYSSGWYSTSVMTNGGNTNINLGSVSSSAFTQTWSTSSGT
jgi:hypothetical protein